MNCPSAGGILTAQARETTVFYTGSRGRSPGRLTIATTGPPVDDNLSSLREKLFIGFFPSYAEYYSQTNGWGIHMKVHGDSPFSIYRGGI
jgi:hypothetical protein